MVRLEAVGKRYPSGAALADISLTLEPGGFYLVTGAAGAGKTTLLNIIALAEPPSAGRLSLFGSDPARLDRDGRARLRRRIGLVFQNLKLIDRLSVRDNIALPLRLAGAAPGQTREDVAELLTWLGLAGCAERPAATLAASERQRVAWARAIVGRPDLLLADEPIGEEDNAAAAWLVRLLQQVNRLGTTVLIATRRGGFDAIGPQRYALDGGRLAAAGAAAA